MQPRILNYPPGSQYFFLAAPLFGSALLNKSPMSQITATWKIFEKKFFSLKIFFLLFVGFLGRIPAFSPKIAEIAELLAAIDKRITLQLNWVAFIITPLHKVYKVTLL